MPVVEGEQVWASLEWELQPLLLLVWTELLDSQCLSVQVCWEWLLAHCQQDVIHSLHIFLQLQTATRGDR